MTTPRPVTISDWWTRALAGERTPIAADEPQCGYYVTRAFRKGPKLPARIWSEGGKFYCLVAGEQREALKEWPFLALHPISAEQYVKMSATIGVIAGPRERRRLTLHDLPVPKFTKGA